jgi:YVTN family beta-propeller protein
MALRGGKWFRVALWFTITAALLFSSVGGHAPRLGNAPGTEGATSHVIGAELSERGSAEPSSSTLYALTIEESGLGDGVSWSATVSGNTTPTIPTIPVANEPWTQSLDVHNGLLYIANFGANTVTVVNGSAQTVVTTIGVGDNPRRVLPDPGNGLVYVSETLGNTVTEINDSTNTVVGSFSVGPSPIGLAVDPAHQRLFVDASNDYGNVSGPSTVTVYNTNSHAAVATITVGNDSRQLLFDPLNQLLYASNYGDGSVWVINTTTFSVVARDFVGASPLPMMVNPVSSNILVFDNVNALSNGVVLSSANSGILSYFNAGDYPGLPAFDPANGWIYLPDEFTNSVEVLNATTLQVVGNVSVGVYPVNAAYVPAVEQVFVTNGYSNSVSVIDGSHAALPTGTTVPAFTESDTVAGGFGGILFNLANGTYLLKVNPAAGLTAVPTSTNITISGGGYDVRIGFYGSGTTSSGSSVSNGFPVFEPLLIAVGIGAAGGAACALVVWAYLRPRSPPRV